MVNPVYFVFVITNSICRDYTYGTLAQMFFLKFKLLFHREGAAYLTINTHESCIYSYIYVSSLILKPKINIESIS